MTSNSIKFSVLIPYFHNQKQIPQVLESLFSQTHHIQEIILCADGCKIPENLVSSTLLKVIKNDKNQGLAFTRNRLLQEASSEYILFIDADCLLEIDSIEALVQKWDGKSFFGGREWDSPKLGIANLFRSYFWVQTLGEVVINDAPYFMGLICGGLKQNFLVLGGFCTKMRNYGEDIEFSKRAKHNGHHIQYIPQLKVYHYREDNLRSLNRMIKSHCLGQIVGHLRHGCPIIGIYYESIKWILVSTLSSLRRHHSIQLACVSMVMTSLALIYRMYYGIRCRGEKYATA